VDQRRDVRGGVASAEVQIGYGIGICRCRTAQCDIHDDIIGIAQQADNLRTRKRTAAGTLTRQLTLR
jgi:hypothetical protein